MSSSELSSSWSSAAERIGLQGRRAILQALGRSVSAAAVADEPAGGGVRAGAVALAPPRHASSQPAAAASRPTGSGTGGSASPGPGDADDALLAAAAPSPSPSPSPGLTAEMALSILVDCFGQ